jgi:hypothetical protein
MTTEHVRFKHNLSVVDLADFSEGEASEDGGFCHAEELACLLMHQALLSKSHLGFAVQCGGGAGAAVFDLEAGGAHKNSQDLIASSNASQRTSLREERDQGLPVRCSSLGAGDAYIRWSRAGWCCGRSWIQRRKQRLRGQRQGL